MYGQVKQVKKGYYVTIYLADIGASIKIKVIKVVFSVCCSFYNVLVIVGNSE
jgi:hypothetical protein